MNRHEQVNKAKKKRFNLLCTEKGFRADFSRWHIKIIGNAPHIANPLPRYTGERDDVKAFREHVSDMTRVYAPRKKLSCGHETRKDDCEKCAGDSVKSFESFRRTWLSRKGYTQEQWAEKVAAHPDKSNHRAPSPEFIEHYKKSTGE